jgi:multimeric flavodoxin WrbA
MNVFDAFNYFLRRIHMSKIIAFLGSPRKKGNTAKLIYQVIAGAKSVGAEISTYDFNEEGVRGCQSCYYCRANDGCSLNDKLQPMYKEIKEADGIVAGFPVYFADIGAQSKMILDRLFPMLAGDFSPRNPGKKFVTVYSQGQPDGTLYTSAMDKNNAVLMEFGWEMVESLLCHGDLVPGHEIPQELLDKAFEAGKKLVR